MIFAKQVAAARRWRRRRSRDSLTGQAAVDREAIQEGAVPLVALPPGRSSRVLGILGGGSLAGRLAAMGFTPGAGVTVLQNAGGLVIVLVLDGRVVLGRAEAGRVLVAAEALVSEGDNG
jgi:Fe2+ transport system protein FeoA